ncbi:MAG: ATP-binding protein [Bacteroidales bacterium]|nr:ATP-binding protein [Bacteroidales bacterium]
MQEVFNYSNGIIDEVKLEFKRYLFHLINWDSRLIEILGARGVGKTTLMLQKARLLNSKVSNQAVYISLDDKLMFNHSIVDIADGLEKYGVKYLFLDEVHKYPPKQKGYDWTAEIKNTYDRYPGLNIVYSGSSALKIYKGHGDLSRRKSTYHFAGLSFREFLELNRIGTFRDFSLTSLLENHQEISASVTKDIKIIPHFKQYLKTGYFPFYNEDPPSYFNRLLSILNVIIETDIPAVSDISFETSLKLKKLLAAIASTVPYVPNLLKLRQELFIADQRTLLKYLDYLEKAEVVNTIMQKAKGNKIMQKPDKIYLGNTNIFYGLNLLGEEMGTIRETFFNSQLDTAHELRLPEKGDFLVDGKYIFEVGGRSKTFKQIKDLNNAYIAVDDIETGAFNQIPLWLFGFLY